MKLSTQTGFLSENNVEFKKVSNPMTNNTFFTATILIADDDPSSLRQLKRVLVNAGYENIISVSDPKRALNACSDNQPDLIFLRLSNQCLEGDTRLDDFKACYKKPNFPIIVLANQGDLKTRLMAHKWGVREFLDQPYSPGEVCFRTRYILKNA